MNEIEQLPDIEQPDLSKLPPPGDRPGSKPHKTFFQPKQGHVRNPLADWPRNAPCWCKSGKKAKKCCLPEVALTAVPKDQAKDLKRAVVLATKLQEVNRGKS